MDAMVLHSFTSERLPYWCGQSLMNIRRNMNNLIEKPSFALGTRIPSTRKRTKHNWKIALALDTGGLPSANDSDAIDENGSGLGGTRLGRIVGAGGRQLLEKLNTARKNFPMKIFLLLFGFYTANALATLLGQTGNWDVLVAAVVVGAIEGIGLLMYRKPPLTFGRIKSLMGMVNYWKAGVCLGLFVDAFKLGS